MARMKVSFPTVSLHLLAYCVCVCMCLCIFPYIGIYRMHSSLTCFISLYILDIFPYQCIKSLHCFLFVCFFFPQLKWKFVHSSPSSNFLFFLFYFILFFWLCWLFVSVRGLSPVAASGGQSSSQCAGLSPSRPLLLRSRGSRRSGSAVVAHGPSRSAARGIFPDQGSNPCPPHWQADSQPLRHQGSPPALFLMALLYFCAIIYSVIPRVLFRLFLVFCLLQAVLQTSLHKYLWIFVHMYLSDTFIEL